MFGGTSKKYLSSWKEKSSLGERVFYLPSIHPCFRCCVHSCILVWETHPGDPRKKPRQQRDAPNSRHWHLESPSHLSLSLLSCEIIKHPHCLRFWDTGKSILSKTLLNIFLIELNVRIFYHLSPFGLLKFRPSERKSPLELRVYASSPGLERTPGLTPENNYPLMWISNLAQETLS